MRTVVQLLKNSKNVIDSYVSGVRKKYIAPLAFFAISITFSGLYLFVIWKYFPQFFDFVDSLYTDDLSKEIGKKILEFTNEFNSLLNFLFIPFIALISRIVFYNERYNFTEHLVIFFYSMSLFSMFSILTNLLVLLFIPDYFLIWTSIIYFFFFIYHCYIFTGIFSLSFKRLLLRVLLFLPLFFIAFIFVSILLFYMVLFSGHIDINNSIPQS